jgi:hypothetical protein
VLKTFASTKQISGSSSTSSTLPRLQSLVFSLSIFQHNII